MEPLVALTISYIVLSALVLLLKGCFGIVPIGLVPDKWNWKHVAGIMFVEILTMTGWVYALTEDTQIRAVESAAVFVQSAMILWICIILAQSMLCSDTNLSLSVIGISVLIMPVFAAIAIWSRGSHVWLVWLHTAHRVLIDGWWVITLVSQQQRR